MHFVVVSFLFLSWLLVCELLSVTFSTPEGACEQVGCTNEGRPRRVRMIMLCLSEIVLALVTLHMHAFRERALAI